MSERPDDPRDTAPVEFGLPEPTHEEEETPRRKAKKPPNIRVPALNITSFLDMSFALLTMLILLANFKAGEGVLSANIPVGIGGTGESDKEQLPKLPITIILNPGPGEGGAQTCVIRLDGAPFETADSFSDLSDRLTRVRKDPRTNPTGTVDDDTPIVIRPESDVLWQHVINAFNAAVRARYKSVAFAQTGDLDVLKK